MIVYSGVSFTPADFAKSERRLYVPPKGRWHLRSPLKRGDLYRDFEKGERGFLIVDGEFAQNLAVTSGEILDVIRAGGLVFGSSSMGAMRAAELASRGMIGIGRIFNLIESTPSFRDDWLGHLFDPESFELVTIPFIEFLFLIEKFVRKGRLVETGNEIQDQFDLKFDQMTLGKCKAVIDQLELKISVRERQGIKKSVTSLFGGRLKSQKRRDAEHALIAFSRHLEDVRQLNKRLAAG